MPYILDGKSVADRIAVDLKRRVDALKARGCFPTLNVFTSDDQASQVYVRNKVRRGAEIGIGVDVIPLKTVTDFRTKMIGMQTPFIIQEPCGLARSDVEKMLDQYRLKDMDGFSSANLGMLAKNLDPIGVCTPKGIMRLLREYDLDVAGERVVIIGRSNIVGKPLAMMMTNADATVTLCHSNTHKSDLLQLCVDADIIVSATGHYSVLGDWRAHPGQVLIDVGINHDLDGNICGDFAPHTVCSAYAYTPVPGGVGPMTVISLMENVVDYWETITQ